MSLRDALDRKADTGSQQVYLIACEHGARRETIGHPDLAVATVPCIGALPPSFIDYLLSRCGAAGVYLAGCPQGNCHFRLGNAWMEARLEGRRDPILRKRVPRERVCWGWFAPHQSSGLRRSVETFLRDVRGLPPREAPSVRQLSTRFDRSREEGGVGGP